MEPGSMLHWNTASRKNFGNHIRNHINGLATQAYWEKQWALTEGIWHCIDWESIGRAMQEVPLNRQRWVAKYVSGHFATGQNMNKWKFRTTTKCPRCPEPIEDKQHILECPNEEAHEVWDKSIQVVKG